MYQYKIVLELNSMDWDFAPGSLLVSETGGIATNIGTDDYDYKNHNFLITNAVIHNQLTKGESAIFPII